MEAESTHHFTVETRSGCLLNQDSNAAKTVDGCAERRILSRSYLRAANAPRVHARWRIILNPPIRTIRVCDVVESRHRSDQRQNQEGEDNYKTFKAGTRW